MIVADKVPVGAVAALASSAQLRWMLPGPALSRGRTRGGSDEPGGRMMELRLEHAARLVGNRAKRRGQGRRSR